MKKISNRFNEIIKLIEGDTIADIGSDHAYLPMWLYFNNKIKIAYAADISEKCVEKIKINIKKNNIPENIIIPVLSDGLSYFIKNDIIKKITDIIIAGMGGETIAKIIESAPVENINFILQPNSKIEFLKNFLYKNKFEIISEIKIEDKKRFYTILNAKIKPE